MRIRGTAVVIRNKKVLLVKDRGKQSYSLPGGKREKNEPSIAAASRELFEELGMDTIKAQRIFKCDYKGSYSKHHVSLLESNDEPFLKSTELNDFIWWDMKVEIPRFAHVDQILDKLEIG